MGFGLHKKNHISPGPAKMMSWWETTGGMKMKMLEDQAEYYDYLDDEVWVYLYRFNMVLFWHQFLQRDEHITLELILN